MPENPLVMRLRLHREGYKILTVSAILFVLINLLALYIPWPWRLIVILATVVLAGLILNFFRNPLREIPVRNDQLVYAPCDGKVVVIEEVEVEEYFNKTRRLQISVFMSPLNVHVNRYPVSGTVAYSKYHPGKYLVAWAPKSSEINERTSVVLQSGPHDIMIKQIAGAVARRIVCYAQEGQQVQQGGELGFIKFGSRVDVLLPLGSVPQVQIGQVVKGNLDVLAKFPE